MSATNELHRMLDERGIEYEQSHIEGIAEYAHVTKWKTQAGNKCTFYEIEDGQPPYFTRMFIELPTPEQAVEFTLGPKTCKITYEQKCSECGAYISDNASMYRVPVGDAYYTVKSRRPNFCPNCGRRVVQP